jgi:PAS domain S-box-containing protein
MYQNAQVGIMLAYVDPRFIESAGALKEKYDLPTGRAAPLDMAVLQVEQPEVYDDLFGLLVNSQRLNPALQRMFGYSADELRAVNVSDMIYPEDRGLDRQFFSEMITGVRNSFRVEKRYVAKDGRVFWARLTCSLARRADGSPSMIIGIIEDIDAERRTQEALMQSEARFRAMFDEAPVGMALMSLESKIIQANQSLAHLTGYTLEELIKMAPVDVVHPDYRYSDNELFEELLAGKRSHYQMEKRYIRKDGTVFWGRVNYAMVRNLAGEPLYLVGIMEDIDDARRASEKLAQQEAENRRLLEHRVEERTLALQQANTRLTDEIEQRLRAEDALAHQAADDAVAAERNRLARDLHDAVTQTLFSASLLAEVIPELMKVNQVEAYRRLEELRQLTRGALAEMRTLLLELRPSALTDASLPDLLRQLTEAIIGRARLPVELTVEGEYTLTPEVQVAFYRIAQEALNNVAKYAKAGQVVVSLRCSAGQVRMAVMDNGVGFNPATVSPTHLGMRIMRERAEAIGAKLSVYSEPGEGTQISVTWSPEKKDD